MSQRLTEFHIQGYTWNPFYNHDQVAQDIANSLLAYGYGVQDSIGGTVFFSAGSVYVDISIINSTNAPVATLQQLIQNIASQYLNEVSVSYTGDQNIEADNTGHLVVTDTYINQQTPQNPQSSLWNSIFGSDTSAVDAGGKILGLSVGTLAILGIGYIILTRRSR